MENFNRASAYYPEELNWKEENPLPNSLPNSSEENSQSNFSYKKSENGNAQPNFSYENDSNAEAQPTFFYQNNEKEAKNQQKSGLNLENLMKMLKNFGSADLSTLTSSLLKNQNPIIAQALSQLSSPKQTPPKKPLSDAFEEM